MCTTTMEFSHDIIILGADSCNNISSPRVLHIHIVLSRKILRPIQFERKVLGSLSPHSSRWHNLALSVQPMHISLFLAGAVSLVIKLLLGLLSG
ncbi:hypothetical protein MUK42_07327 [Musa troglodytarum]|uniref:Uncharacterized protein n=1 Tax=Musa troglodytarum TaxID=320322 RepID=A0A9E7KPY7_9LILI|nr:hypothetical protein MUK42_07327 [Musa troglodytarum]